MGKPALSAIELTVTEQSDKYPETPLTDLGFEPPTELRTARMVLRPLRVEHNLSDFVAWTTSAEHIRSTPGFAAQSWPDLTMTIEQNEGDLRMHERHEEERIGFTYTVLDPADESTVIGCVYIYGDLSGEFDVHVRSWVKATHADLDVDLCLAVHGWLASDVWPFDTVRYARRAQELSGLRVAVTRTRHQASSLSAQLRALGSTVVEVPMIELVAPMDGGAALDAAVERIEDVTWCVLTSPNGTSSLVEAVQRIREGSVPETVRFAAVGPATAAPLRALARRADLIATRHVGEGLVTDFPAPSVPGERVLIAQAEVARPTVVEGLTALGWDCVVAPAYRTVPAAVTDADRQALKDADVITFASSSSVDHFCDNVDVVDTPDVVACIGPITANTATTRGLTVTLVAEPHTIEGLVTALRTLAAR